MPRLLIIGAVWPEPKSSAAGSRMMQVVDLFQNNDFHITFATACAKTHNAVNLKALHIDEVEIALNTSSFDTFVKNLNPDCVLFDRFMTEEQFGWRVAEQCPEALRVLDTEDLHCLRKGRHQALKDNKPFNNSYLFNDTAKREIASIYRCDLSLIISKAEMTILENDFKVDTALLYYLPFMLNEITSEFIEALPSYPDRNNFMTIGNFLHAPNLDAVGYLKQTIWPLIKKELPDSELHIYGAYTSQNVEQLHNEKEGFLIKGFAEDVHDIIQKSRVCLAPLRFGAGLKGKLVDAMCNGTPYVTSTIGAEGLVSEINKNANVQDDPAAFAERAVTLFNNQREWESSQKQGYRCINERFAKSLLKDAFITDLKSLKSNLTQHRQHNFMGQLIQHHSLQSTKYMSKWIEEKNKKS